jgi:formamidopyrimidine-DNA glycosylase
VPELPEVHTTTEGIKKRTKGLVVLDVWSDYFENTKSVSQNTIKNKSFFQKLRENILGQTFVNAERRGKNILIHLSNQKTILIHMKMTGHLMYGIYEKTKNQNTKTKKEEWVAIEEGPLKDPFNRFIHFIIQFDNGYSLAFSDMRKFAKVTFFDTKEKDNHPDLKILGPEPLEHIDENILKNQLFKKPNGKIKTVLMDQSILAGIGNIYSDEILWASGINPERIISTLTKNEIKNILKNTVSILNKSISLGGDSMSDYRNIDGERGGFQKVHNVYKRNKQKCLKKGCGGVIVRKVIGGRSAHFCPKHQK